MDKNFNPNDLSVVNGNYFALPFSAQECELVIVSVAWDVTVSYREGTASGPAAIIDASAQVDLYDIYNPNGYKKGIGTVEINPEIEAKSSQLRADAVEVIELLSEGCDKNNNKVVELTQKVNQGSEYMNEYVYQTTKKWLDMGKKVALVGGDHSTPFGYIKALSEREGEIAILHIDAHADLREAYEGFEYSHASIMYNVIDKIEGVNSLVQVGIRDFCDDEMAIIENNPKISTFFDSHLSDRQFMGDNWDSICRDIVHKLKGKKVYISFDIDGLSPDNCPSTGTPVPGGLSYMQAIYLINMITQMGKTIVGFDLVEVAPSPKSDDEWDANVGARMLYKLCNLALK
ncbi:MAG: agmatinase family protein [Rikenellaceae bacterium]